MEISRDDLVNAALLAFPEFSEEKVRKASDKRIESWFRRVGVDPETVLAPLVIRSPLRARLYELIREAKYTRQGLMTILIGEFGERSFQAVKTYITNAKKFPSQVKDHPLGGLVAHVDDESGIFFFPGLCSPTPESSPQEAAPCLSR